MPNIEVVQQENLFVKLIDGVFTIPDIDYIEGKFNLMFDNMSLGSVCFVDNALQIELVTELPIVVNRLPEKASLALQSPGQIIFNQALNLQNIQVNANAITFAANTHANNAILNADLIETTPDTLFSLHDAQVQAEHLCLAGHCQFNHTKVITQTLDQQNATIEMASGSTLEVKQSWMQDETSSTQLIDSCATAKNILANGKNDWQSSELVCRTLQVTDQFAMHASNLHVEVNLAVQDDALLALDENTKAQIKYVTNRGNLAVKDAAFASHMLNNYGDAVIDNAKFKVESLLQDYEGAHWTWSNGCEISAGDVKLHGHSVLNDALLKADSIWQFGDLKTQNGQIATNEFTAAKDSFNQFKQTHTSAESFSNRGESLFVNADLQSQVVDNSAGSFNTQDSSIKSVSLITSSILNANNTKLNTHIAILQAASNFIHSQIDSEYLSQTETAKTTLSRSSLKSENTVLDGEFKAKNSELNAGKLSIVGDAMIADSKVNVTQGTIDENANLALHNTGLKSAGDIHVNGQLSIDQQGAKSGNARVSATNLINNGTLHVDKAIVELESLITTTESKTILQNSMVKDQNAILSGDIKAQYVTHVSTQDTLLMPDAQLQAHHLTLKADKDITFLQNAQVDGTQLNVQSHSFTNATKVNLIDGFTAQVDTFQNFGQMSTGKIFDVRANYCFENLTGHIGSENTSIKSGGYNLNFLGDIQGSDSLTTRSLANINLMGSERSWNYNSTTLLNLNAGLTGSFTAPSSSQSLLSTQRLIALAKLGVTAVSPSSTGLVNLAHTGVNLAARVGKAGYEVYQDPAKKVQDIKDMRWVDWMNTAIDVAQFAASVTNFASSVSNVNDQVQTFMHSPEKQAEYAEQFTNFATGALRTYGGVSNTDSIFDLNVGGMASTNQMDSSLFSLNQGEKANLQSTTNIAKWTHNNGDYSALVNGVNLSGQHYSGKGDIHGKNGINMTFKNIHAEQGSDMKGNKVHIVADNYLNEGNTNFSKGSIQAKHYQAHIGVNYQQDMHIAVDDYDVDGDGSTVLTHCQLDVKNLLSAQEHNAFIMNNTVVNAGKINNDGDMNFRDSRVNVKGKYTTTLKSHNDLQNTTVHADSASLAGAYQGQNLNMTVDNKLELSKDLQLRTQDAVMKAKNIDNAASTSYKGNLTLQAQETYHSTTESKIQQDGHDGGSLSIKANVGDVHGQIDADKATLDFKKIEHAEQLIAKTGQYSQINVREKLDVKTEEKLVINEQINRHCDLSATGSSIDFNVDHSDEHNLHLKSLSGDVNLNSNLHARNIDVESARKLTVKQHVDATQVNQLTAQDTMTNHNGRITGDKTILKAAVVINEHTSPEEDREMMRKAVEEFLKQHRGHPIPPYIPTYPRPDTLAGVISGRDISIESTKGNIENHVGAILATEHLHLKSAADVKDICGEHDVRGRYGKMKHYEPALIGGGNGNGHNGVGLHVEAQGRFINDASNVVSQGTNEIIAQQGIESTARTHTYVSFEKESDTWYGKHEHKVQTSAQVQGSTFVSSHGKNILKSAEGGLTATATHFISEQGTQAHVRDDVRLMALKTTTETFNDSSQLFGLEHGKSNTQHHNVKPVVIADHGVTILRSDLGSIKATGAEFVGDGDLELHAKKQIELNAAISSTDTHNHTRSVGLNVGPLDLTNHTFDEPSLRKLQNLNDARNPLSELKAAWCAAQQARSDFNLISDTGNLSGNLLSRYKLGDKNGFNPQAGVKLTQTDSMQHTEAKGPGGIHRRNVTMTAGESVTLNGIDFQSTGNTTIKTKVLNQNGLVLHQDSHTKSESIGVNGTATSASPNLQAGYSHGESHATTHVNQQMQVGGNLHLELEQWNLDASNVATKTITGHVDKLNIKSEQDTSNAATESYSASTSGVVSAGQYEHSEKVTKHRSSLHIRDGINHDAAHQFDVGVTELTSANITTDGVNHYRTRQLQLHELHDSEQTRGAMISTNPTDMLNVVNHFTDPNPLQTTLGISTDYKDHRAVQHNLITGKTGTDVEYDQKTGDFVTDSRQKTTDNHDRSFQDYSHFIVGNEAEYKKEFNYYRNEINGFFGRREQVVSVEPHRKEVIIPEKHPKNGAHYNIERYRDKIFDPKNKDIQVPLIDFSKQPQQHDSAHAEHHGDHPTMNRVVGGANLGVGGFEMFEGGLLFFTGPLGIIAGLALLAHGSDTAVAGVMQLGTGEQVETFTAKMIEKAGFEPRVAEVLDASVTLLSSAKSAGGIIRGLRSAASYTKGARTLSDGIENHEDEKRHESQMMH